MKFKRIAFLVGLIVLFIPFFVVFMSFNIPIIGVVLYIFLAAIVYKKTNQSEKYCGLCGNEFMNKVYKYSDGQRKLKICANCNSELRKRTSKEAVKNIK